MTSPRCDREPALIAALRAQTLLPCHSPSEPGQHAPVLSPDLAAHAAHCSVCSRTREIAPLLLRHAAALSSGAAPLPPFHQVLYRAEQQRSALALARATRALRSMYALGVVYLVCLLTWSLRALSQASASSLLPHALLTTGTVPLGAAAAIVVVFLGATTLTLLGSQRLSRRTAPTRA